MKRIPFVVPAHLTANIPDRIPAKKPRKSRRIYSPEESRRLHIKYMLRIRHSGPKLDTYIKELEQRLEILKEIRDELIKS